jgi:hypothetical protein
MSMPLGFANFYVRYRSKGIAVNLFGSIGDAGRIALPGYRKDLLALT